MTRHPNWTYDDDEDDDEKVPATYESNQHREEQKAMIRAQNAEKKLVDEAEAARVAENKEIATYKGLPRDGETRDQLLDRIRKMREEKPEEFKPEGYRSEGLLKAFNAEQEAGRAAVAKAKAELELYQEALQRSGAGEKNQ